MTRIYLAFTRSGEARRTFKEMMDDPIGINLLVSYVYVDGYETLAHEMPRLTGTMLDSGAFSAWRSGAKIDIDALIAESKKQRWKESVCLDVIGKPAQSVANAIYMQDRGSPAFPVFHFTDPWEHLDEYKRRFDKIGLSCRFGESLTTSLNWLDQCFARGWPHKFHSFGWVSEKMLIRFPFHSADTASWNNRPNRFGAWKAFGRMSLYGQKSLRAEVNWYRALERRCVGRWAKTLATIPERMPLR